MKLYFSPGACSLSPHIVLRETGAKFDLEQVNNQEKKTKSGVDYWSVNGKGQVPVLEFDNGDRLTLLEEGGSARLEPKAVACGTVYLDDRPETVDAEVVRERRQLAEEGVVVVLVFPRDGARGDVGVVSRGVAAPSDALAAEVSRAAREVLARASPEEHADPEWLRAEIAIAAKRACRRSLGLRPVIVPVVV